SACALRFVPDVPGTSTRFTPPYVTVTFAGAPCPKESPTTRSRFDPTPGLKAALVTVATLLPFTVAVLWKLTAAQAWLAAPRSTRAATRALRPIMAGRRPVLALKD